MMRSLCALLLLPSAVCAQPYFQQHVAYTIDVRLDDSTHVLRGLEEFIYTNNSTVTLDTIHLHLWPNAYRDHRSALCKQLDAQNELDLHFAKQEERGHIDSLAFSDTQGPLTWGYDPVHPDIGWLLLRTPLAPGQQVTIRTPFLVKIPDGRFSRLGHTDQAYYITQWYPKPAVFDAQGWHAMPYLTLGEFYSEFGSFDVSITLPANYVVGATGELQNPEERAWMDSLSARPLSMSISKGRDPFPPSDPTTKTIRFKQDSVHDFAWFADKRFQVRKSSIALPRSGNTVTTWALFTPKNAALWDKAASYVSESVRLYSQWVGDYPYRACTAVDGTISAGGGMEYPMITIIGNMDNAQALDEVIAHEVGHNWFYGLLGSNERDHAWMDEGVNSFVELRYMRERYPDGSGGILPGALSKLLPDRALDHRFIPEATYRLNARRNLDQRIEQPSAGFTALNYGAMVYSKSTLVFDHLFAYLGEEVFDRCMQAYFREWHHKHPGPQDMRAVFERESGKDLGWLFEELITTDHKIDVRAVKLKDGLLTHRTRADHPIPFPVTGWNGKDSLGTVWSDGAKGKGSTALPWPNASLIKIDAVHRSLDIDRRNNLVRDRTFLPRAPRTSLRPLLGITDERRSWYWAPALAYNAHDGFMAGLAVYNTTFPSQPFEWVVAPLYGFASERPTGVARMEYHFDRMRSRVFQNIHIGLSGRTFSTFQDHDAAAWFGKLSPSIRFDVERDPLVKPWAHAIGLRGVRIWNTEQYSSVDDVLYQYTETQDYVELQHVMADTRRLHPSAITTTLTAAEDWLRGSIEIKQAFAYNARNKQLRLRLFAGTFLNNKPERSLDAWGLTWGPEDMMYDHSYLERGPSDHFLGRQFNRQQGAFKTPFFGGGSETWMISLNTEFDLPFSFPIAFFASAGWIPEKIAATGAIRTGTYAEAGIGLPLVKDVLEVWLPLIVSKKIADEEEYYDRTVSDRIRFVLALEKIDPTKLLRNIRP